MQNDPGTSLFTLLGFLGMYSFLSILWIVLVYNFIEKGPTEAHGQRDLTITSA